MDSDSQNSVDLNASEISADLELSAKQLSDRFLLIELIGEGASSKVYKAEQKLLNQIVAIKVLKKRQETDEANDERFKREARLLSKLIHPNIARSFGFGLSDEGEFFLVMEY